MSQTSPKNTTYFLRKADKCLYRIVTTNIVKGKTRYILVKIGESYPRRQISEQALLNCYVKIDKKRAQILYGK